MNQDWQVLPASCQGLVCVWGELLFPVQMGLNTMHQTCRKGPFMALDPLLSSKNSRERRCLWLPSALDTGSAGWTPLLISQVMQPQYLLWLAWSVGPIGCPGDAQDSETFWKLERMIRLESQVVPGPGVVAAGEDKDSC